MVTDTKNKIEDSLTKAIIETALHERRETKLTDKARKNLKKQLKKMKEETKDDYLQSKIQTLIDRLGTIPRIFDSRIYQDLLNGCPEIIIQEIDLNYGDKEGHGEI